MIRRARRDDVAAIVAMLADDRLGSARERLDDPLPPSYFAASRRSIAIRTSSSWSRRRVAAWSAAAALHPAGPEFAGRLARLLEDVRVASDRRRRGIANSSCMGRSRNRAPRAASWSNCSPSDRVDAQRFYERLGFQRSHVG